MHDKRITVSVKRIKDRPTLMLQWFDPDTNKRRKQVLRDAHSRAWFK